MYLAGVIILLFLFAWHWDRGISIHSILYHRGASHAHFTFKDEQTKKKYYWKAFLTLGSSYLSPRAYAIMHRMHHEYADTDSDPHRPYPGFLGSFKMMWETRKRYNDIYQGKNFIDIDGNKVRILDEFKKDLMDWPEFDRFAHHLLTRSIWAGLYILMFLAVIWLFSLHYFWLILVVPYILLAPLHGWIVNDLDHSWGERRHNTNDTSRNMTRWLRRILRMKGENLHNEHHKFPGSINFAVNIPGETDEGFIECLRMEEGGDIIIPQKTDREILNPYPK